MGRLVLFRWKRVRYTLLIRPVSGPRFGSSSQHQLALCAWRGGWSSRFRPPPSTGGTGTGMTGMTLVDAGSVIASVQASMRGHKVQRSDCPLDMVGLLGAIRQTVEEIVSPVALRDVRWFDGAPGGRPNEWHIPLMGRRDVTVVLGRMGKKRQKRVDVQLSLDLAFGAEWGASNIVLVSGDGDLVSAVECARGFGARVTLLRLEGMDGCGCNKISPDLAHSVDQVVSVPLRRIASEARPR